MLSVRELRVIATARLRDAEALLKARRFDGAVYLCGYAVEIALKARICKTLDWAEFPQTNKEFEGLLSLRTHDLDVLLRLSGVERKIKGTHLAQWSLVQDWRPEKRYSSIGTAKKRDANEMVQSARALVRAL
jgi:HEPN domain-containing protein